MIALAASLVGAVALLFSAGRMVWGLRASTPARRLLYACLPLSKLCVLVFTYAVCAAGSRPANYAVAMGVLGAVSAVFDNVLLNGLMEAERLDEDALMEQALAEQVELQKKHLAEAEKASAEASEVSKRILARRQAVAAALEAGDASAASAALSDLVDATYANNKGYCSNKALDALIGAKAALCADEGIDLRVNAALSARTTDADASLCAVVANLVDNAMAACRTLAVGERWIELKVARKGGTTVVSVKNPMGAGVPTRRERQSEQAGELFARHGWGQKIVASIVERNGGSFVAGAQDGVYTAQALVNL